MPLEKSDAAFLWDMLDAATAVRDFVHGKSLEDYGEIQDDLLWSVATVHIPALIASLEPLVPQPPRT